jgi:UDP-N-acetyl-D-galactosamine dehydrogenase
VVVVGLGYVGLPLAVALAQRFDVVGFDINVARIADLKSGKDRTGEVEPSRLEASGLRITGELKDCRDADIYIVTVPTPINAMKEPDLAPLISASKSVAKLLEQGQGQIVVYESTVYPGVTGHLWAFARTGVWSCFGARLLPGLFAGTDQPGRS